MRGLELNPEVDRLRVKCACAHARTRARVRSLSLSHTQEEEKRGEPRDPMMSPETHLSCKRVV